MDEKKTIEELIGSIYKLISEARNEYEMVVSEKNKLINNKNTEIHSVQEIIEHDSKTDNNPNHFDWSKKKFEQTNNNYKRLILSNENKVQDYNKRFNKLMEFWIQKNLNSIIEKEFSIFIKNKS
ncbi:MAG: hypothetical protein ACJ0G4_06270 [Alphaproteobacteria bacterium]